MSDDLSGLLVSLKGSIFGKKEANASLCKALDLILESAKLPGLTVEMHVETIDRLVVLVKQFIDENDSLLEKLNIEMDVNEAHRNMCAVCQRGGGTG